MWCFSFHVFLLHLFCSLLHPPLPFYKVFLFCLLPPFLSSSSFLCCIIACFLLLSPPIPHCFLHLTSPHLFFLLTPLSHSFPHLSFLSPSPLPSLPPPPPHLPSSSTILCQLLLLLLLWWLMGSGDIFVVPDRHNKK